MMKWKPLLVVVTPVFLAMVAMVWAQNSDKQPAETGKPVEAEAPNRDQLSYTASGSLVVTVSPEKDHVWAYSTYTGFWRKQSLEIPLKKTPFINSHYAALEAENALYVFSARKGTWVSLTWNDLIIPKIAYHEHMVIIQVGEKLSAFSAETGSWDTITLEGE